jgi:hypothetical protein
VQQLRHTVGWGGRPLPPTHTTITGLPNPQNRAAGAKLWLLGCWLRTQQAASAGPPQCDLTPVGTAVHATLAQPAAGADALKDLRPHRSARHSLAENSIRFREDLGLDFRA